MAISDGPPPVAEALRGGATLIGTPTRLLSRDLTLALLATFTYFVGVGMLLPELPRYVVGPLDGNGVEIGVVMGTFLLTACAFRSVAGSLTTKSGSRFTVMVGCAVMAASIAGYGIDGLPGLLVARAITGVGEAAVYVGISGLILDLAPKDRGTEATSYFTVAFFGGVATGPVLGELVRQDLGFTAVWLIAAAATAATLLVTAFVHDPHVALPVDRAPDPSRLPGRWRRILQPDAVGPGMLFAISMIGYAGFMAFLPLYVGRLGLSNAGPVFAEMAIIIIVIRIVGARLPAVLGALRCSLGSFVLQATGWIVVAEWTSRVGLYGGTAVAALGVSLLYPALFTAAVDRAPPNERGYAIGTFTMLCDVAVGLGAVILGAIVTLSGGEERHAFEAACVVNVVCLALVLLRRDWVKTAPRGEHTGERRAAT